MKLPLIPQALALVLFAGLLACTVPVSSPVPDAGPAPAAAPYSAPPRPAYPVAGRPVMPPLVPSYAPPREVMPTYVPAREFTPAPAPKVARRDLAVHVTRSGKYYHKAGCTYLKKSDRKMPLTEAMKKGFTEPCSKCFHD